jgi:hypothetical protein
LLDSYLVAIPSDPMSDRSTPSTWYTIRRSEQGRVTVAAPSAEHAEISVTR